MIKSIQNMSKAILTTILVSALVSMLGIIWLDIQDPFAHLLSQNVSATTLLFLPIVLLLLLMLAIAYIISLHIKIKDPLKNYEYNKKTGILHNPKDNLNYCLSCKLKNIKSPLQIQEKGWLCLNTNCNKFYPNPDNTEPTYQAIDHKRERLH